MNFESSLYKDMLFYQCMGYRC